VIFHAAALVGVVKEADTILILVEGLEEASRVPLVVERSNHLH
jgi:hypothetical protein